LGFQVFSVLIPLGLSGLTVVSAIWAVSRLDSGPKRGGTMISGGNRRGVIIAAVIVGAILVVCIGALWWALGLGSGTRLIGRSVYRSNGEQIYFTATSQRGTRITSDIGIGGMMRRGGTTCAGCHGANGLGGRGRMMMSTFEAPDIRYSTLTAESHGDEDEHAHEPWTEETIKRAITEGIEPDGEALEWPMPRWSMSDEDLDDLLEFLKALD